MADTIRVIYKPVGRRYEIRRIPNTLEACQELVGGYIEPVTICTDLVLVCNEEGRNLGLEPNPFLGHDFRGDWFLCGRDGEEFADVPEDFLACVIDLAPAFVVIRPGAEDEEAES